MRKISLRKTAVAVAVGAAVVLGSATPALAISRVSDQNCATRNDYLTFINNGRVCFANAGSMPVMLYAVDIQENGNNAVYVTSTQYGTLYGPYGSGQVYSSTTITYIQIL